MKYAFLKDDDVKFLMDVHEYIALPKNCKGAQDLKEDEGSMSLKLVYGG